MKMVDFGSHAIDTVPLFAGILPKLSHQSLDIFSENFPGERFSSFLFLSFISPLSFITQSQKLRVLLCASLWTNKDKTRRTGSELVGGWGSERFMYLTRANECKQLGLLAVWKGLSVAAAALATQRAVADARDVWKREPKCSWHGFGTRSHGSCSTFCTACEDNLFSLGSRSPGSLFHPPPRASPQTLI